ncbi:bursicon-like isoform X1 [Maniola hyperantus]|uniref:bursicon-like isoform X1 n=1 Tax=Aphantopus hyperantus TaxID=2795564 RepID=UPI00156A2974|nr:bursicon [Maniola hyperantus]
MFSLNFLCMGLVYLSACHVQDNPVNGQEIQLPPGQECQMTPVIHVLQHPGCVPKPIPSYACIGKCSSYVQVSGSKIWQMERSCNCCQESGEREATVVLFCPKAKSEEKRFRKVSTKAPLECMCRPCGIIEENSIIPQEIAGYADDELLQNQFRKNL